MPHPQHHQQQRGATSAAVYSMTATTTTTTTRELSSSSSSSTGQTRVAEFKLRSAGQTLDSHVMRIQNQKCDLNNLVPPIRMFRQVPEGDLTVLTVEEAEARIAAGEKLDPSKIPPGVKISGKMRPFKKKSRQMFLGFGQDGEDPLKKKAWDPDKFPWAISDFRGNELIGNAENQSASYMLFVLPSTDSAQSSEEGFMVQKASKCYRFNSKPSYQPLTMEEAEAQMKKKDKHTDRWFMRKEASLAEESEKVDGIILKSEDLEIINREMKKTRMKLSTDSSRNERLSRRSAENRDLEEELDFDEVVSDDENIDFGIEDENEAKEARNREFGRKINRAEFDDDLEDEEDEKKRAKNKNSQAIKKALKKFEGESMYVSDDEANPYGEQEDSEEEEEELEKKAEVAEKAAEKAASPTLSVKDKASSPSLIPDKLIKREPESGSPNVVAAQSKPGSPALNSAVAGKRPTGASTPSLPSSSGGGSTPKPGSPNLPGSAGSSRAKVKGPGGSSGGSPLLDGGERKRKSEGDSITAHEAKKIKIKLGGSPDIPPPPPSAAEIVAKQKEEDRQRRLAKRLASATSPTLSSKSGSSPRVVSPALSKASSPQLTAPSPSLSSGSTSPATRTGSDADLLTDNDILELFNSSEPPTSVKDIVNALKDRITRDKRNKDRIRDILKRLCSVSNGVITLKK